MTRTPNTVEKMIRNNVRVCEDTKCWNWHGKVANNGYGHAVIMQKSHLAHRVFYSHFNGAIEGKNQIDHLCRNRRCVNPEHLEQVTAKENNSRGYSPSALNSRKKECKRGHMLSGENLYVTPDGRRQCRICRRKKTINTGV